MKFEILNNDNKLNDPITKTFNFLRFCFGHLVLEFVSYFEFSLSLDPGYSDFVGEVKAAMRVCEGAIIMVCAASGIEVGTEQTWAYSEEANLPRFIFVNKMDRENADFSRTLAQLQEKFGSKCVPLQIPIGAQDKFEV